MRVKPLRSSADGSAPPKPGIIRAGIPDGRETTLGAAVGVPVVEEVSVGTWSGSVSDILSNALTLKLEKIKEDCVNHANWVLLGGGAIVVDGVDTELRFDDERGGVPEGKLREASLGREAELSGGKEASEEGT